MTIEAADSDRSRDPAPGGWRGPGFLSLLQLASPTLPIGAFAYSQGLEPAVAAGVVTDEASAAAWILGLLRGPLTTLDLAVFARIHAAHVAGNHESGHRWNAFLFASRPTAELQTEDRHLGAALGRVLETLGLSLPVDSSSDAVPATYVSTFAGATAVSRIDLPSSLSAFAFTWAEAQVSAAVRLVPLGQSSGVRILGQVTQVIPGAVEQALGLPDDRIGGGAPLQAIFSAAHETQYSRLFRS